MTLTKNTCIVCNKIWETDSRYSHLRDKFIGTRDKFVLCSFFRHFGVPFPFSVIKWNFQQESLPFCSSCNDTVHNFLDLHQQLDSIQKAIERLKKGVRDQISGLRVNGQHGDRRIRIMRDLIAGPTICLNRVKHVVPLRRTRHKEYFEESRSPSPEMLTMDFNPPILQAEDSDDDNIPLGILFNLQHKEQDDDPPSPSSPLPFTSDDAEEIDNVDDKQEPEIITLPPSPTVDDNRRKSSRVRKKAKMFNIEPHQPRQPQPVKPVQLPPPPPIEISSESEEEEEDSSSSSSGYEDDPRDKNFVPDQDQVETERMEKFRKTLATIPIIERDYIPITEIEDWKYEFGGFEFTETTKGYTCSTCNTSKFPKYLRSRHSITDHIRRKHMNERPYKCPKCETAFFDAQGVAKHIPTHDEQMCQYCGEVLKSELMLTRHIQMVHEPAFSCSLCPEKFHTESRLVRHIESVHAFGPVVKLPCEFCDLALTTRLGLMKHMKRFHSRQLNPDNEETGELIQQQPADETTTRNYCNICKIEYQNWRGLNCHLRSFHKMFIPKAKKKRWNPGSFFCCQCGKNYAKPASLRKHEFKAHGIPIPERKYKHGGKFGEFGKKNKEPVEPQPDVIDNDNNNNEDEESDSSEDSIQEEEQQQQPQPMDITYSNEQQQEQFPPHHHHGLHHLATAASQFFTTPQMALPNFPTIPPVHFDALSVQHSTFNMSQ